MLIYTDIMLIDLIDVWKYFCFLYRAIRTSILLEMQKAVDLVLIELILLDMVLSLGHGFPSSGQQNV